MHAAADMPSLRRIFDASSRRHIMPRATHYASFDGFTPTRTASSAASQDLRAVERYIYPILKR